MPSTTLTSPTMLPNDLLSDGAMNPWECHTYSHTMQHVEDGLFCEHIAWSMSGDIPVGLSMDAGSGTISGDVLHFGLQPSCQDNYPIEVFREDGGNYTSTGRFKELYFDFIVTIQRDYLVKGPNADGKPDCATPLPESVSGVFIIRVVKNHDIDNLLYLRNYLKAGYYTKIEDERYYEDKIDELISLHPGPFPVCEIS